MAYVSCQESGKADGDLELLRHAGTREGASLEPAKMAEAAA